MSIETPDLTKKKEDFNKLPIEEQEKIYEDDRIEALAVDKILTKGKTLSENENNWYQFTKRFRDNENDSFSNKEAENATKELETSVNIIKKEIHKLLMELKNGEHKLSEGADSTIFHKTISLPCHIQNSKIIEYLAKQLGGEFRTFKDRPEDSLIQFTGIMEGGLYRTTKDGDTQRITDLYLSSGDEDTMEINVAVAKA